MKPIVFSVMLLGLIFCADLQLRAQTSPPLAPGVREFVKVSAPVIALTHTRVIDGTRSPARNDQTIVISGGKIQSIGDSASTPVPAGAQVVDLTGKTVIPGLVGMHEHMFYPAGGRTIAEEANSPWPTLLKKEMQFERDFVKAGGVLLAGEDPTGYGGDLAGFGDQRELELLVQAGFTPTEAIHIYTENGARFLGEDSRVGTLAAGKQADIVVIDGDPSTKISDIEKTEIVFKDGVGYDSAKLIASVRGSVGLQ